MTDLKPLLDYVQKHQATITEARDPLTGRLVPFVVVNGGIASLENVFNEARDEPVFARGVTQLDDRASFISWVRQFKVRETRLFASSAGHVFRIEAVIDNDTPCSENTIDATADADRESHLPIPGRRAFRAAHAFVFHDRFKVWNAGFSKWLKQDELAELLEEGILEIVPETMVPKESRAGRFLEGARISAAAPVDVLSLAKGLELTVSTAVKNVVNLSNGTSQVAFEEKHAGKGGQELHVPKAFVIALPILADDVLRTPIAVRVRYRLREGSLQWFLAPYDLQSCVRDAIESACWNIQDQTGVEVFQGMAPAPAV